MKVQNEMSTVSRIENKIRKNYLRWFDHKYKRS